MPRLNRTFVENMVPPVKGETVIMDSDVKGFGVRMMPSGACSYFARYRILGGRSAPIRRATLGKHPVMTPEKARQLAKDILADARKGIDPMAEKKKHLASITVQELITAFIEGPGARTRKGRIKSAASFACDKSRLLHHVTPVIGKVKLCDLNRGHIEKMRNAVASGETARPREKTKARGYRSIRGGEGAAGRAVACLSSVLGYAIECGYITHNPAKGVQSAPSRRCERFLSVAEIGTLKAALSKHKADRPQAVGILNLLLLTGCRLNEIASLTWAEVDLQAGFINLKTSKTGERVVYLSSPALDALAKTPRKDGSAFVFPAIRGDGHHQGTQKAWQAIRATAKLEDVRIHDLRHTYASTALAGGTSLEVIAKLLGHSEVRTTARYAHFADHAVREAANRVGAVVVSA
jgi:integrase